MAIRIQEFKAAVKDPGILEEKLLRLKPLFRGEGHQTDTYFNVNEGRLKLREGNIENALIYYKRPDIKGSKQSDVILFKHNPSKELKDILTATLGVKTVVAKKRKIYFIDNAKFHFDVVNGLGTFIEVEIIDETGVMDPDKLKKQCNHYREYFNIGDADIIAVSYSDLIMSAGGAGNIDL